MGARGKLNREMADRIINAIEGGQSNATACRRSPDPKYGGGASTCNPAVRKSGGQREP
jgi:hypothetical protein